jgi:hypothetical protein
MPVQSERDPDMSKGAVEQNSPEQTTNVSLSGQMGHRDQDSLLKSNDSDYPERGQNPEHSGEPQGTNQLAGDSGCNPEGATQNQDPGRSRKRIRTKARTIRWRLSARCLH